MTIEYNWLVVDETGIEMTMPCMDEESARAYAFKSQGWMAMQGQAELMLASKPSLEKINARRTEINTSDWTPDFEGKYDE